MPKPEEIKPRWEVPLAILHWTLTGQAPPPGLEDGKHRYRIPYEGPSGARGGSANLSLQAALADYLGGVANAEVYLTDRAEDELRHYLGGGEQNSPYAHLPFWALAWHRARLVGDARGGTLFGAWVELHLLFACLCARMEGGRLRLYRPGRRFDGWPGDALRAEEAMIEHLLGIGATKGRLSTNMNREPEKWWWWGILLEAVRSAPGIEDIARRVRADCLRLLEDKRILPDRLGQVRYLDPVTVEVYGPGEWFAYQAGGHQQDPTCAGGGWFGAEARFLWPWGRKEKPPEEGWSLVLTVGARVNVEWRRHGVAVTNDSIDLPFPEAVLFTGEAPSDPLGDLPPLPPLPGDEPRKPGAKPEPPPEDPEEEPMPEEPKEKVPPPKVAKDPDLRRTQVMLETIRDGHIDRDERRWADRSLKKLNKAGAWDWEE